MDVKVISLGSKLIPHTYLNQAIQARKSTTILFQELIVKRNVPFLGWDDDTIELFLREISKMDSNNFIHNIGVGEREARIFSGLVARRHFGFGHGIGRSGDLTEPQPKAAGSSLLLKITNDMLLQIVKLSGILNASSCILLPMATGMSLVSCLLSLKHERPNASKVLWPRIDQKSCFKAIGSAGYEAVVIENIWEEDQLRTDLVELESQLSALGSQVAAVVSTTSCFAPRAMDKVVQIAELCYRFCIPHIINNAYGLQSTKICHEINQAARSGRVDLVIQSTDKNLMVPVGGSIVASFDEEVLKKVCQSYPGRASASPMLDVIMTLLSMGSKKYKKLCQERKETKSLLLYKLSEVARDFGLKVLNTKDNDVSVAITVPDYAQVPLGSMLFLRGVSGTRMVTGIDEKTINGHLFKGWGYHSDQPKVGAYLTAAASIGMPCDDVNRFVVKLRRALKDIEKKSNLDYNGKSRRRIRKPKSDDSTGESTHPSSESTNPSNESSQSNSPDKLSEAKSQSESPDKSSESPDKSNESPNKPSESSSQSNQSSESPIDSCQTSVSRSKNLPNKSNDSRRSEDLNESLVIQGLFKNFLESNKDLNQTKSIDSESKTEEICLNGSILLKDSNISRNDSNINEINSKVPNVVITLTKSNDSEIVVSQNESLVTQNGSKAVDLTQNVLNSDNTSQNTVYY